MNINESIGNSKPQLCGIPFFGSSGKAIPIPPWWDAWSSCNRCSRTKRRARKALNTHITPLRRPLKVTQKKTNGVKKEIKFSFFYFKQASNITLSKVKWIPANGVFVKPINDNKT